MLVCVVRFGMFIHLYFFFVCVFWLLSCARVDFKLIYILSLCAGDKKTYLLDKTHWQKKPRTKQYGFTICQWNNTISRDSSNLKGSLKMRCEMELCDLLVQIWLICSGIVWMFFVLLFVLLLFLFDLLLFNEMVVMETDWIVLFCFFNNKACW